MQRRRLPGEGDIDLPGVLRALREGGSRAPLGVEVFSDALGALPVGEVARRARAAVGAVVAEARC